jgi:hypothetical protein
MGMIYKRGQGLQVRPAQLGFLLVRNLPQVR